jgi:4-hydroxy-tetrahydrodipicolinate synthase
MTQAPDLMAALRAGLSTLVAIPVTPFGPDGGVDWDSYAALIARLVGSGVEMLTPNGNTGEYYALTDAETRRAVESAVAAADGRADVMAGRRPGCCRRTAATRSRA